MGRPSSEGWHPADFGLCHLRMRGVQLGGQIKGMLTLAVMLAAGFLLLGSGALTARRPALAPNTAPASMPQSTALRADEIQVTVGPTGVVGGRPGAGPVAALPEAPVEPYVIKHILPIEGPLHMGDHYWDERGAPEGPIMITVDLAAQTLSVFRGGYEIGTAAILYGADDKPTPLGVFPITQKDADHVSNLYDAPMPYMLRLTNDGVSIHGTTVIDGYMTHGCIGVPTAFAKKLFGAVKLGDRVIITRGEMLSVGSAIKAA